MIDRFGPMPAEAQQLIAGRRRSRRCAGAANVAKLDAGPKGVSLTFRDTGFPGPLALVRYIQNKPLEFKARPDGKLIVNGNWPTPPQRLKALRGLLDTLDGLATKAAA